MKISIFSKFAVAASIMLAMAFTISCSSDNEEGGGGSSSSGGGGSSPSGGGATEIIYGEPVVYEGETYQTVVIGTQTWFARNLNYDVPDTTDVCYDNDPENCTRYGRLYSWATALALPQSCNNSSSCESQIQSPHKGICPEGWHIPSGEDWSKLFLYVDEQNGGDGSGGTPRYDSFTAGKYLKATSGWNSCNGVDGNGIDKYGFSALPGGQGTSSFMSIGIDGSWWSTGRPSVSAYNQGSIRYMECRERAVWIDELKSFEHSVRCVKD